MIETVLKDTQIHGHELAGCCVCFYNVWELGVSRVRLSSEPRLPEALSRHPLLYVERSIYAELEGAANGVALYELGLRRRGLFDGTDRAAQRSAEERNLQHFPDRDSASRALAPARLPAQRRMDQACLRRAAA